MGNISPRRVLGRKRYVGSKVRYGSFNLIVEDCAGKFVAHVERTLTKERVGQPVTAPEFDQAVMFAKLEALRLSELQMA
jgi:hypothetical protein